MSKNTLLLKLSFLLLFAYGCAKKVDVIPENITSSTQDLAKQVVDTSKSWYGSFQDLRDPDEPANLLPDDDIISNGVARIPFYWDQIITHIMYDLPDARSINMDSSAIDITLKDNFNYFELTLTGSTNRAWARYIQIADTGFYTIILKSKSITAKVYPATDFTSFKLVRFAFKKSKVYLYVANKLITSFDYDTQSKIGRLKKIDAGGDGYIELDKVALYNSFSKQALMKEDFNINGQSHTIFY